MVTSSKDTRPRLSQRFFRRCLSSVHRSSLASTLLEDGKVDLSWWLAVEMDWLSDLKLLAGSCGGGLRRWTYRSGGLLVVSSWLCGSVDFRDLLCVGLTHWFDEKERKKGFSMLPLSHLTDKQCGFLVDGEVEIVAQINVCESGNVRKLDVSQVDDGQVIEFQTRKPNAVDHDAVSSALNKEMPANLVYVNGFRVLPSQVSFVKRIFGKHPETALECCTKNQDLRTSYINVLFSLIKMLNKEPQCHTTDDDLSDAEGALAYMKNVGFKLNWLEKKLDEIKETKKRYARVSELQQKMQDLMNKYRDAEKQLEKERAEIIARATVRESLDLAFSDVV